MVGTKTYYCECGEKTETIKHVVKQCGCGKLFGAGGKPSNHINMRTTWSGQTKVEFSTKTIDEDIAERNSK